MIQRVLLFVLCALSLAASPAYAGGRGSHLTSVSYSMASPLGNTKDFVDRTSFRGLAFDFRSMRTDNLSLGIHVGWNVFDEHKVQTTTIGNVTVTGFHRKWINTFPIMVTGDFYTGDGRRQTKGTLGFGVGVLGDVHRLELGTDTEKYEEKPWHFLLSPSVGILTPLGPDIYGHISFRYHYGFGSGNLDAQSYVALNIGIAEF